MVGGARIRTCEVLRLVVYSHDALAACIPTVGVPYRTCTCVNRVAAGYLATRPRGHGAAQRIRTAITWLEARNSAVELEPLVWAWCEYSIVVFHHLPWYRLLH